MKWSSGSVQLISFSNIKDKMISTDIAWCTEVVNIAIAEIKVPDRVCFSRPARALELLMQRLVRGVAQRADDDSGGGGAYDDEAAEAEEAASCASTSFWMTVESTRRLF